MRRYIELDALVAEIEKLNPPLYPTLAEKMSYQDATKDCIDIIYAHKVKEVNLEKVFNDEYSKFSNDTDAMDYAFPIDLADYKDFARHFFELGLKVRHRKE